jgi:hypothetical protein
MKMKRLVLVFSFVWLFVSCQGNKSELIKQLEQGIQSCDSMQELAKNELTIHQISETLNSCKQQYVLLKMDLVDDTLKVEDALKIDVFVTAYKNAISLDKEWIACIHAADVSEARQKSLKMDIESNAGDRAQYVPNVLFEQREVQQIRNGLKEVQQKLNTLLDAQAGLEPVLSSLYP